MEGEGPASQIRPTGAFDALDLTNIRVIDLLHVDKDGVEWDASFDPSTFEASLRRTVTRDEILLENLTASPPPGEWLYPSTRAFRVIPKREMKISLYYESDANIEYINMMVRFLDRDKTFISAPTIKLEANVSKREIHGVTVPEGIVYAQVQLAAKSYAGVTGTASFKDVVVFGDAVPTKKPWFERNPSEKLFSTGGTIPAGTPWTDGFSYTVPSGRMARIGTHGILVIVDMDEVNAVLAVKGTDGVAYTWIGRREYAFRDNKYHLASLIAGEGIVGSYRNADTVDRLLWIRALVHEFDQD